ncbi:MAG: hypothetical protein SFX19_09470 [Alphaproteobacteria bacterium]|nr:hypothetical protein [Alphaproteobacteria bacterium]
MTMITACAHKAPLKTPTEIAKAEQKKEAKAKKDAEKKAKREAKEAAEKSKDATVPEAAE